MTNFHSRRRRKETSKFEARDILRRHDNVTRTVMGWPRLVLELSRFNQGSNMIVGVAIDTSRRRFPLKFQWIISRAVCLERKIKHGPLRVLGHILYDVEEGRKTGQELFSGYRGEALQEHKAIAPESAWLLVDV